MSENVDVNVNYGQMREEIENVIFEANMEAGEWSTVALRNAEDEVNQLDQNEVEEYYSNFCSKS